MKNIFKTLIEEADWMDSTTKQLALEKAAAMSVLVAYPDWVKNKTALEQFYDGVLNTFRIL